MQYTISQLYDLIFEKANTVYDIFKGFFGEDNVDLCKPLPKSSFISRIIEEMEECGIVIDYNDSEYTKSYEISDINLVNIKSSFSTQKVAIHVWWKSVTVTNEHNKSINIQDLYARIDVRLNGRIPYENVGFLLNRATYTKKQFLSNYLHSHIKSIPKSNFATFMPPCLGQGPIKETIATLKNDYDEAMWMLFCQELSMYVTVESLSGGPWQRLESVGSASQYNITREYNQTADNSAFLQVFSIDKLKEFIKYYLEHGHLTVSYKDGQFTYGMPYFEYIIDVSNSFIDFYNNNLCKDERQIEKCFSCRLLLNVIVSNGKFYTLKHREYVPPSLDIYRNKHVLEFKGKDILLNIIEPTEDEENEEAQTIIIRHTLAMYILHNILNTINYRYTNEYINNIRTTQKSAISCKRAIYI